jgi:hypothetical protein
LILVNVRRSMARPMVEYDAIERHAYLGRRSGALIDGHNFWG